jgi:uncharacterized protein YndB with AHSA1/START domain
MATLRRTWQLDAGPRATWNAFTTPEGLCAWLAETARVDARAGGRIVLRPRGEGMSEESGILHTCRPTARLEIRFDRVGTGAWKDSLLSVQIGRDGARTALHLAHESPLLDVPGAEAAAGDWWDEALVRLEKHLDG